MSYYRKLSQDDIPAIIDLLEANYGDSYSYKQYLKELISTQQLISYGIFNNKNEMYGHTALITKDISNDYFESGLTMRHPRRKSSSKELERELFNHIMEEFKHKTFFIHQNTTTYHHFAQMNGRNYMHTNFCGLIVSYASGENLYGVDHGREDMNAIVYTTVLNQNTKNCITHLPAGKWGEWLGKILNNIQVEREISYCKITDSIQ